MHVEIIRVTHETASCLDRLAIDVFDGEPDRARVERYLAERNHALFVAIANREVVGQARGVLHFQPDLPTELYIDNLGVAPHFKRQGVATRLVRALIEWARAREADIVWVATEPDNEEARGFYASFGFSGETMAYYMMD